MTIDLGLSFDSEDYQPDAEDADLFVEGKRYSHTFNEVCKLCDRQHFPGLIVPTDFQRSLNRHLKNLGVEDAQRFIDSMDEEASWQIPSQISAIAIEEESRATESQQTIVFLRALADTLNDLTGGELVRKIIIFSLEEKIIAAHKAVDDIGKIRKDLTATSEDTGQPTIASRVEDLLEFSKGVRQKRLDNLIDMYRDECEDKGVEPKESVIKEGKFENNSSMQNIMDLLEGNNKL